MARFYQVARPGGPRSGPLRLEPAVRLAAQIIAGGDRALVFRNGEAHHFHEFSPNGLSPHFVD